MEKTAKVWIDGVNLLKELVAYKGESIISNRTIPLEVIEEMALSYYDIKRSPSNKLYVYVQLVKYFKQRGMFLGELIKIPEIIYQRIRPH
ncbi:hypothetical protein [Runella zeae]|jgi:hypothetical protein|uniref:hypothetical protein n=1 Tax=Runella zeae TaxID=94255 RepID=UPI000419C8D0|nr:hypothetical protein [Runella zeae]